MQIKLDLWQEKFINTEGDKILCTGRQVGKSVICAMDAAKWAIKHKNQNILMIAPTERQAYALFEKTLNYLLNHHKEYISRGKDKPTKTKINLKNGVRIYCLPVGLSGIGIRFLTIGRLYVDEASRIPEEVWAAITPMLLTTGGNSIYLSTPFGAVGEFYRCWVNKNGAYDSFTRFSTNSEEVIRTRPICATWTAEQREKGLMKLEQEKARMSGREYAQEYLGEFIEKLNRYFSEELIQNSCVLDRKQVLTRKEYYLGVDIARMGEDESSFEILEKTDQGQLIHVENIITRKTLTTETESRIIHLNRQYDEIRYIYIDAGAGSLGVGILDHLLKHEETKNKVVAINNRARSYDRYDKSKTKLLKQDLYDNLRALMERGDIKLLKDDNIVESLRSVQYEYLMKEGEPTRLRIFGNYTHIVEGLIRAAWCVKDKALNIWVHY